MIRGFYDSVSGMVAMSKRMEAATTNLANVQTNGYKQERTAMSAFAEQMVARLDGTETAQTIGPVSLAGVSTLQQLDWSQGPFQATGRELDLALAGPGVFTIETPDGIRYTRNGAFVRNADGVLTTITGRPVLGQNGPVQAGSGQISVLDDGTVLVDGNPVDKLQVVEFGPAPDLQRSGNTELLAPEGGPLPEAALNTVVRQGFVESSNVDVTATLTTIIEIQRAYEANQRMIQSQDELIGRAANEIADPTA